MVCYLSGACHFVTYLFHFWSALSPDHLCLLVTLSPLSPCHPCHPCHLVTFVTLSPFLFGSVFFRLALRLCHVLILSTRANCLVFFCFRVLLACFLVTLATLVTLITLSPCHPCHLVTLSPLPPCHPVPLVTLVTLVTLVPLSPWHVLCVFVVLCF